MCCFDFDERELCYVWVQLDWDGLDIGSSSLGSAIDVIPFAPRFARWSAVSFPAMPTCAGTQKRWIVYDCCSSCLMLCLISLTKGSYVFGTASRWLSLLPIDCLQRSGFCRSPEGIAVDKL